MKTRYLSWLMGIWLLAGTVLLLATSLPVFTPLLGWAPLLWLVISPLAMLCIHDPQLPVRLLSRHASVHAHGRHRQAMRKTVH